MSEIPDTHSLVQRLAVDRVAAPGVLDRRTLQRAHDRFVLPARAHVMDRLQRRVAPASPSGESLPLVRIDRSVDVDAPSPTKSAVDTVVPIANADGQQTAVSPVANKLVARQQAGVVRVSESVTRRVGAAPGLIGGTPVIARSPERSGRAVTSPGNAPLVAVRAATRDVVQRVAESRDTARVSTVGEVPVTTALPAHDTPAQSRASLPVQRAPIVSPSIATVPAASVALPRVQVGTVMRSAAPLLWRKAKPIARSAASSPPVIATWPAVTAASTPLVLRSADAGVSPDRSFAPAASMSSMTTDVTRGEAAASSASDDGVSPSANDNDIDIDWIAEQVGNRLARRLEIERERLGVRQWRQVS